VVNEAVRPHKTVVAYAFHDEPSNNVDLRSPKVGKCRDEIEFCREFVNLGICFT
jgi:hypothetical protein